MSGITEGLKKTFSNPASLINPLVAGTSDWLMGQTSAPDLPAPGSVPPPAYNPGAGYSTDAEDYASRQLAAMAANAAPGSASSVLTTENDPLGTKRQRLLGL